MRYLSHVDEYLTLKYKYKYQVLHLWTMLMATKIPECSYSIAAWHSLYRDVNRPAGP